MKVVFVNYLTLSLSPHSLPFTFRRINMASASNMAWTRVLAEEQHSVLSQELLLKVNSQVTWNKHELYSNSFLIVLKLQILCHLNEIKCIRFENDISHCVVNCECMNKLNVE